MPEKIKKESLPKVMMELEPSEGREAFRRKNGKKDYKRQWEKIYVKKNEAFDRKLWREKKIKKYFVQRKKKFLLEEEKENTF